MFGAWHLRCAAAALLAASLPAASCWAAKTDQVTLVNGDRITGEVKLIEQGRLVYSTDDLGTVRIEWDKVVQVVSQRSYEVELYDGSEPPAADAPSSDWSVVTSLGYSF